MFGNSETKAFVNMVKLITFKDIVNSCYRCINSVIPFLLALILSLRNQKCKVFDDKVITCESVRNASLIAKKFKYKVTVEIPYKS